MVQPVQADPIADFIIEQSQNHCDAEQASFRAIDDDLAAPLQGVLSLAHRQQQDTLQDGAFGPNLGSAV